MRTGRVVRQTRSWLGFWLGAPYGRNRVDRNEVEVFRIENRLCRVDAYGGALKAQVTRWLKTCLLDELRYEYEKPHPLTGRRLHGPPSAAVPHPLGLRWGTPVRFYGLSRPCRASLENTFAFPRLRASGGVESMRGKQKREGHMAPRVHVQGWVIRGSNPGPWD